MNTTRKGYIGQLIVIQNLLENYKDIQVYEPVVDDKTIDLLVISKGKKFTINVKYHTSMNVSKTQASIQINLNNCKADWIATPHKVGNKTYVLWFKNNRPNDKYVMSIAVNQPKNNQVKGINFYEDFLKSPLEV